MVIDWSSVPQLLQVGLIGSLCFAVFLGYRSGDKL